MTKAPEKIWAWHHRMQDGTWVGQHAATDVGSDTATEYTRTDIADAAYERGRIAGLREAEKVVSNLRLQNQPDVDLFNEAIDHASDAISARITDEKETNIDTPPTTQSTCSNK